MNVYENGLEYRCEPDYYLELVQAFPLRHIRSDSELDEAIGFIDTLIQRGKLRPEEQAYFDVLTDIVEKYEAKHHPMPQVSDADLLRYLIEAQGITQACLAKAIKVSDSIVSDILRGKRELTRKQVILVSSYFKISPSTFINTK